ncbi:class 1 fructose-bisphosphatase [Haloglomus salinum]|jgi:fructose-1,6-bisphosphatase I|uniref:class 1 fructose-bisphosphatase n=1 Tax=Haloglomus salinum TaxID=2962673 RepID=UPI0020CA031D|nr:class 1 fructose-bisphosphatase [Haloglomus salinum]
MADQDTDHALARADATVRRVVETVAETAPDVRGGLAGRRMYDPDADENPSGERQLAADLYADDLLEDRLLAIEGVGGYASEEREEMRLADDEGYHVACDPLDGSSNLKSNNAMGTIFGVYDAALPAAGDHLVAAGYVLYGPITTMALAVEGHASEYVVEDGTLECDTPDLTIPDDPVVYGFGGRVPDWPGDFAAYVDAVEDELKLRYGGAMIADVNQVVTYGGVFAYPALESAPDGKLRLVFEGAPIAYVIEAAGGASSNGDRSLLEVEAEELHQRVPVHVGSTEYIERLETALD